MLSHGIGLGPLGLVDITGFKNGDAPEVFHGLLANENHGK